MSIFQAKILPFRTETIDTGFSGSKRLHIRDISSGIIYLIDTGSDISLFLTDSSVLKNRPSDLILYAANDSHVCTFGERSITLNFNLRRPIKWDFCIASVPYPRLRRENIRLRTRLEESERRLVASSDQRQGWAEDSRESIRLNDGPTIKITIQGLDLIALADDDCQVSCLLEQCYEENISTLGSCLVLPAPNTYVGGSGGKVIRVKKQILVTRQITVFLAITLSGYAA